MSSNSPFHPDNDSAYQQWRRDKLSGYPRSVEELIVDIADPANLSEVEYQAMLQRLRKCNMVIYRSQLGSDPEKAPLIALAARFGLQRLDSNLLADEDGLTSITVNPDGEHARYIPYTDRPINWHSDGYYNRPERQVRGMLLHCVRNAAEGGANRLLDPEMLYLQLRDESVEHIRALMADDVMTIPPGLDGEGDERGASVGPVFSIAADGSLHTRFTARKRNIKWKQDAATAAALIAIERLLQESAHIFRATLSPGMGLLCNNVLHTREPFTDGGATARRLLYRARFLERISTT